jgi:hypothetical protein
VIELQSVPADQHSAGTVDVAGQEMSVPVQPELEPVLDVAGAQ